MKVAVLGAGATGLAAAYLLARAGAKVTLLEASSRAGGLLATFDAGEGHRLEHYYHHFFTHDAEIHWLLGALGLADRILDRPTTMAVYRSGRSWPFCGARDLLRFRAIGLAARFRFGFSSLLLSYLGRYARCEDRPCLEWFGRVAGRQATDAIWRPLLEIKFGPAAERIPLAWMAGRLRQRARSRKLGGERLGYLEGSLQVLVDRLVEALGRLGVELRLDSPTDRLLVEHGSVTGAHTPHGEVRADAVLATVPTPILARLVRPHLPTYADELQRIEYLGAICTILATRQPLTKAYWTNVTEPGFDFGGVIEQTRFVPPEHYGGRHLTYLSRYLSTDDPLWSRGDADLLDRQLDQLGRMLGRPVAPLLIDSWIFRARHAATLTDLGFHRRIPAMRSPLHGLFVASMPHIYPDERSVNNSIRVAAEAVRVLGLAGAADLVPRGLSLAGKYGQ